jgi:hypothetical protein
MLLFLKGLGTILAKSQVGNLLLGLGGFAAGLSMLSNTVRDTIPSAPMTMVSIFGLVVLGLACKYATNYIYAKKTECDIISADARRDAAKAERDLMAAKARAKAAEARDD